MIEVIEPATERVMAEVPRAGIEETNAAIAAAKRAFPTWREVSPVDRAELMRGLADALEAELEGLSRLEARNAGKPIGDARGEISMVVECFRYYAGAPERLLGNTIPVAGGVDMTFREPLGVVGLITPWNFPLVIASWKVAPAMAAGNTVVLKPAELTSSSGSRSRPGFPRGCSTWSRGRARSAAAAWSSIPMSPRSRSPGRPRSAEESRPGRRSRSSG